MRRAVLVFGVLVMMSCIVVAQEAQWTIWQMPSSKSFPGDLVWMVDDSLFVSLHSPQALARFEPAANRLIAWKLDVDPGEFVWTNSGLLFASNFGASVGWLQPDANYVQYWKLPSPMEQPILAMSSSFGNGVENMWYLDWGLGRLGLFEPTALTMPAQAGPEPQVMTVPRSLSTATSSFLEVSPETYVSDHGLVQSVYQLKPVTISLFREWQIATVNDPLYAFVESYDGHVWIPGTPAGTMLSLAPSKNEVSVYKLPRSFTITGLSVGPDGAHIYFLGMENDILPKIGVIEPEHDSVTTWDIPGAEEIDANGLISTEDALWFCDRGGSAVYRFVPATGAFTWWKTGSDDGPLYIVPGKPGEFWVSWEDSGKIARLTLPGSQDAADAEL